MSLSPQTPVGIEDVIQQLQTGCDMPAELLEIFNEEAEDHLRTIYEGLDQLKQGSADTAAISIVRRAAHTLKGAAGAVGLHAATRLSHRMEDLLDRLAEQNKSISENHLGLLLATTDQLQGLTMGQFDVQAVAGQIEEWFDV